MDLPRKKSGTWLKANVSVERLVSSPNFRLLAALTCSAILATAQDAWRVHDTNRPNPPVVTPAQAPGGPPSDAVILFDGSNLDQFESQRGGRATWPVENGYFVVKPNSGSIQTKRAFGDCQIHVEWASPNPPQGVDQMRGNSGLIIMGLYELQILDSYHAKTYADGQAGAIYGQYPPLVNASRAPGEWQTYDVIFRQPRFDVAGHLVSRARETVIHNGIVVQDSSQMSGPTAYHNRPPYFALPDRLPLVIQDHGTPVRYRNLWIRELPAPEQPLPVRSFIPLKPDPALYQGYVGEYESSTGTATVSLSGDVLTLKNSRKEASREVITELELVPMSEDGFTGRGKPGADLTSVYFTRDSRESPVRTVVLFVGGHYTELSKK